MNEKNRKLLEKVIEKKLDESSSASSLEERDKAFRDALSAIDRSNESLKLENSKTELESKIELEKEKLEFEKECKKIEHKFKVTDNDFREKEHKKNFIIRTIEVAVVPVGLCIINIISRNRFAKKICLFEKDYTFTTTPGRSLKDVFKFK